MNCSHIQFCIDKSKVDFEQLQNLFIKTAFWAKERKISDLELAIANSNPVVTVWDKKCLIGFARATSDGIYRAAIWDVIIDPDYQGVGLGRKLVETVLSDPLVNKVERIYLTTTHQQSFYERIGFKRNDTTTMVLYNFDSASDLSLLQERLPEEYGSERSHIVVNNVIS
jgi:N-acetylglutamate synthase-like GNAT family acetyltransferase